MKKTQKLTKAGKRELASLKRKVAAWNHEDAVAEALGRGVAEMLQSQWPAGTHHWSIAFGAAMEAVEDDRGCSKLLVEWTLEHLGGHLFRKLFPRLTELGQLLKGLRYTARDQFEFNDLDNHAWLIPHDKKTIFILESQSRRKLVILEGDTLGSKVHVRRVWYQYDDDRRHFWRKPLPLRWYRQHGWKPEYGDCRDQGYIASYETWPAAKVDGAAYYWGELESLRFDVESTLGALKEAQTARLGELHASKKKPNPRRG